MGEAAVGAIDDGYCRDKEVTFQKMKNMIARRPRYIKPALSDTEEIILSFSHL
jgi:hypothetical protein